MIKKSGYLIIALFIEGIALIATELIGSKLLCPFYGNTIFVWTSVLIVTILGLSIGYLLGGYLSKFNRNTFWMSLMFLVSGILIFNLPHTAQLVIQLTSKFNLHSGILSSSFLLLIPPIICQGATGPIAVALLSQHEVQTRNYVGVVYATSTLGNVFATFMLGYYFIPIKGLQSCSSWISEVIIACGLSIALFGFFMQKKRGKKFQRSTSEVNNETQKTISQNQNPSGFKVQHIIYLIAIAEGFTVMAVELLSARMLAPYFGTSLFVWSTVIGMTLFALAIGYFLGYKLAVRNPGIATLYHVMIFASIVLSTMHWMASTIPFLFENQNPLLVLIITSALLLLPTLSLLGMLPALLIQIINPSGLNSGFTTGVVFSISSLSGILSLALFGFLLIPAIGLTYPTLGLAIVLGLFPFIKLMRQKQNVVWLFPGFIVLSFCLLPEKITTRDIKILQYAEGLSGQILVADIFKNGKGEPRNDRILFVNRIGQTTLDNTTGKYQWHYINFAVSILSYLPENSSALLLGLGGGSVANALHEKLNFKVDAVELDDRIIKIAEKYFKLSAGVHVINDDARHYLETTAKKYDVIFFDAFKGEVPPSQLLTRECFIKAKSLLNPGGILILNFNGFLTGDFGRASRSVYTTLKSTGMNILAYPTPGEEDHRNMIYMATELPISLSKVRSPLLFKGHPVNLDTLNANIVSLLNHDEVVFGDDKSEIEIYNFKAGNIWRLSYNKTYTPYFRTNGVPLFK